MAWDSGLRVTPDHRGPYAQLCPFTLPTAIKDSWFPAIPTSRLFPQESSPGPLPGPQQILPHSQESSFRWAKARKWGSHPIGTHSVGTWEKMVAPVLSVPHAPWPWGADHEVLSCENSCPCIPYVPSTASYTALLPEMHTKTQAGP